MANDTLIGGKGNDTISGGGGDDSLYGLDDNDTLSGGTGFDRLFGDGGDDVLDGGDDDDLLWGGEGNDTLTGGNGNDEIHGGAGTDIALFSGPSTDYVITPNVVTDAGGNVVDRYWVVSSLATGDSDVLRGVERARFSDGDNVLIAGSSSILRASEDGAGIPATAASHTPLAWSANGKEVAFLSEDATLVQGSGFPPSAGTPRLFAKNVETGAIRQLDEAALGNGFGASPGALTFALAPDLDAIAYQGPGTQWFVENFQAGTRTELTETTFTSGTLVYEVGRPIGGVTLSNDGARALYRADVTSLLGGGTGTREVVVEVASGAVLYMHEAGTLATFGSFGASSVQRTALSADGGTAAFAVDTGGGPGTIDLEVVAVGTGNLLDTESSIGALAALDLSANGTRIAFLAESTLNAGPLAGGGTIAFVKDIGAPGAVVAVAGPLGDAVPVIGIDLSADGSKLAFTSASTGLVATPVSGRSVFVTDLLTGEERLISTTPAGASGNGVSDNPVISADGSRIAFQSLATDLLAGSDGNGASDVFVFDATIVVPGGQLQPTFIGSDDRNAPDTITGAPGRDVILARSGDDHVLAGDGDDHVDGGNGDDQLDGGTGNDVLNGNGGADFLFGGDGDDTLDGGDEGDSLFGGDGNDVLRGGDARTIFAGANSVFGQNYLDGGAGNDTLIGGGGDDVFLPGPGDDLVIGTPPEFAHLASDSNRDTVSYASFNFVAAQGVDVDLAATATSGLAIDPDGGHDTLIGVENVYGTISDDVIRGDGQSNGLEGNAGNDILEGRDGDDQLTGGDGNDTIDGGAGSDFIRGDRGNDVLIGGAGNDILSFAIDFGPAISSGITIHLPEFGAVFVEDGLTVNDLSPVKGIDSIEGFEGVWGTNYDDTITGNSGDGSFFGWGGDDRIAGGGGNDIIEGGAGIDVAVFSGDIGGYSFTQGFSSVVNGVGQLELIIADTNPLDGDDGTDRVYIRSDANGVEFLEFGGVTTSAPLVVGALTNTFNGTTANDLYAGTAFSDTAFGGAGNDTLLGADGDDTLFGEDGNDFLEGGAGNDTIFGGNGDDIIVGDSGNGDDILFGEAGNDEILGHGGNDTIDGGADNDILEGGEGNDVLAGGDGEDIARFLGARAGYSVTTLAGGSIQVTDTDLTDGDEGTDTISGVEKLRFRDVDVPLGVNPNIAPIAADDAASGDEDDTLSGNVLANDSDANNDALTATLGNAPAHGTVVLNADGSFVYTPGADFNGADSFTYTVSDGNGGSASASVALTVNPRNDAPTVDAGIGNTAATEDAPFAFVVPANAFADVDAGDTLAFAATLANGAPLPAWLTFDAATRTFSGTPANDDVGAHAVRVTATDSGALAVFADFTITVANTNDAPIVLASLPDQAATQDSPFAFAIDAGAFSDPDAGDVLQFTAALASGGALPDWITFDPVTRTFSGTPGTGATGNFDLRVTATDAAGLSASADFSLLVASAPSLTLAGTPGPNALVGGRADDVLLYGPDGVWGAGRSVTNAGSPGNPASGTSLAPIGGRSRSHDVFDGGAGVDTLRGTAASEVLLLDDAASPAPGGASGPRVAGIEHIAMGDGDDVVDLTSTRYTYGDVTIEGGTGNDVLWASSGNDVVLGDAGGDHLGGGAGNDYLYGGDDIDNLDGERGNDLLQGGGGDDVLSDNFGRNLFDGGAGIDRMTGGAGTELFIGGAGNDGITTGSGADIIAFNRGDGRDTVASSVGVDNTLSIGGGIRYQDIALRKSGSSLVVETGAGESVTLQGWYNAPSFRHIARLQVIAEAMSDFDALAGAGLPAAKVERFDFQAVAGAFDAARALNPALSSWNAMDALLAAHLAGSDAAAIGGDLAYRYGLSGSLAGIGIGPAQAVLGDPAFGSAPQALRPLASLQEGAVRLA
jgi:VCBS repeat-containing protein